MASKHREEGSLSLVIGESTPWTHWPSAHTHWEDQNSLKAKTHQKRTIRMLMRMWSHRNAPYAGGTLKPRLPSKSTFPVRRKTLAV